MKDPFEFEIADAVPADAEAILAVKDQGWREAYAHLLAPEFLAALDGTPGRADRWREMIASDGGPHFAVARSAGNVVGTAGAGRARDAAAPAPEELYTVYVLARAQGTGAASALVDRVLGDRPAFLWVFEDNPRARAFYTKLGFVPDGARQFDDFGGRRIAEIRMVRWT